MKALWVFLSLVLFSSTFMQTSISQEHVGEIKEVQIEKSKPPIERLIDFLKSLFSSLISILKSQFEAQQENIIDERYCEQNRDCIVINISDSFTGQPIQNATVKLVIHTPCLLAVHIPCLPQIISEKQTNEMGFVIFYKDEIANHSLIKHGWNIHEIIIDAENYNTTSEKFDYEYNQIINFELELNVRFCERDSDCVKVGLACCSCNYTAINKKYEKIWNEKIEEDCRKIACFPCSPPKEEIAICSENKCKLSNFICPNITGLNCMPSVEPVEPRSFEAPYCRYDYRNWIERNCPNITFVD